MYVLCNKLDIIKLLILTNIYTSLKSAPHYAPPLQISFYHFIRAYYCPLASQHLSALVAFSKIVHKLNYTYAFFLLSCVLFFYLHSFTQYNYYEIHSCCCRYFFSLLSNIPLYKFIICLPIL